MLLSAEEIDWIKQALMKQGLLELFKDGDLESLVSGMLRKSFGPGTKIIVQGTSSDFVYLIRRGEGVVWLETVNDPVVLGDLTEGEFFGETAVMTHLHRNASVVAKTPMETYMIFREDFRKLLGRNKAIAVRFDRLSRASHERIPWTGGFSVLSRMKNRLLNRLKIKLKGGEIPMFSGLVEKSSKILALTGAGLSVQSGFTEVHGKGGTWDRFRVVNFQEFLRDEQKRKEYWRRKKEYMAAMTNARPSLSHRALAGLEKTGKLLGIVTQNIDGLHQMAGNSPEKVIELNGTNREIVCLKCGSLEDWRETYRKLEAGVEIPLCGCGGLLKPNTISVGQDEKEEIFFKALSWAKGCDLCIAAGSSLKTKSAAHIVKTVKQFERKLVLINPSPTEFDSQADLCLKSSAEDVIPSVLAA